MFVFSCRGRWLNLRNKMIPGSFGALTENAWSPAQPYREFEITRSQLSERHRTKHCKAGNWSKPTKALTCEKQHFEIDPVRHRMPVQWFKNDWNMIPLPCSSQESNSSILNRLHSWYQVLLSPTDEELQHSSLDVIKAWMTFSGSLIERNNFFFF